MNFSVIIIGAGAAGLLAAQELSAAGFSVLLLEASDTPGGRIHTLHPGDKSPGPQTGHFSGPVEAGAEFVHGSLPITLRLLKEGGISYHPVKGRMVQVQKGEWGGPGMFDDHWDELMQKMEQLPGDLPLYEFLTAEFPGEKYIGLRESAQRFAEGYDLADIHTASTRALYQEWQEEGQEEYRIDGGYSRLIDFMAARCVAGGCQLRLSSPAKEIRWQPGRVEVTTADGTSFTSDRLIVTVSLGVLQLDPPPSAGSNPATPFSPASLQFFPPIPDHDQAARQLGFGAVIKILMEFREPFWQEKGKDVGFIISDQAIPTWWLQSPKAPSSESSSSGAQSSGAQFPESSSSGAQSPESPSPEVSRLITGWLTGAALKKFQQLDNEARTALCLSSLASIFGRDLSFLKEQLQAMYIGNWPSAPFIRGGYSFDTVFSREARKVMRTPVRDTLFFAGEALYEGPSPGTVEAAFTSGEEAAKKIISLQKKPG